MEHHEALLQPLRAGTKDYLSRAVVPTLIDALTKLSIARPEEPHLWLAKFMLDKSPLHDLYSINRVAPGTTRLSYRQLYLSANDNFNIDAATALPSVDKSNLGDARSIVRDVDKHAAAGSGIKAIRTLSSAQSTQSTAPSAESSGVR